VISLVFGPVEAFRFIARSWKLSIGLLPCGPQHPAERQGEPTPYISKDAGRKKLSPTS